MNVNQINDASVLFNTTITTQSNIPNDAQRTPTSQLIVGIIVSTDQSSSSLVLFLSQRKFFSHRLIQ